MIERIFVLIICHMIGDYVLQSDYIATTKGSNWWHLLVHCVLYLVPFYIAFGFTWQLIALFVTHFIIDAAKARYKFVDYVLDQCMHFLFLSWYLM